MLKRVHKQTALSLHKNTTKLTSIDTQVQVSEYIGGLNLPSNAVCYAEIRVWHPLRGQESRCKFQTTHFHWPSNFTPCSIEFLPHSDGRKRNLAVSEIFRIFNMAFVETSKAGCAFSLKVSVWKRIESNKAIIPIYQRIVQNEGKVYFLSIYIFFRH